MKKVQVRMKKMTDGFWLNGPDWLLFLFPFLFHFTRRPVDFFEGQAISRRARILLP
jgi:hypothetical protein